MLILFLLLWLAIVKGEPRIEKSPVEFIQDESGSVICTRDEYVKIDNTNGNVVVCLLRLNNCNIGTESLRSVYNLSKTTNSVTIGIAKISRERDGGIWVCSGFNDISPVTIDINVRVPVPYTNIENKGSLIFKEYVTKDVKCKTGPSYPPVTTFNWTVDGRIQPTSSVNTVTNTEDSTTTSTLRYQPSKLHNSKTLQCTAYNGFGQSKSDSTVLNVQFGVSSVEIENKDSLTFIDGDITSIKCLVGDSNPTATIRWSIENQQQSETSNIFRYLARKPNNGETLTCTANNGIDESKSDSISLNIQYFDKVKMSIDKQTINEADELNITCSTKSNPKSSVTWLNGSDVIETINNINKVSLVREKADCLYTGNYSCKFSNSQFPSQTETTPVYVTCSPRLDSRKESSTKLSGNIGETMKLEVQVISYPKPTFQWYYLDNNTPTLIVNSNLFKEEIIQVDTMIFKSLLEFKIQDTTFYRDYKLQTEYDNNLIDIVTTSLLSQAVPDKVTSFKVTNISEDSICVEWKPGFNGGAVQDFIVEYSTDNSTWINSSPDTKLYDESSTNYCIRNLLSNTVYFIRIFSRNRFGSTSYSYIDDESDLIKTSCLQEPNKPSGTDRFGAGFGAGIGTSLAIVLIIIIVLVFIYRYRKRKTTNNNNEHYATFNRSASANDQTYQELSVTTVTTDRNLNQNSPNNTDRNIESQMERPYANVQEGKRQYDPYVNT